MITSMRPCTLDLSGDAKKTTHDASVCTLVRQILLGVRTGAAVEVASGSVELQEWRILLSFV